MACRICRARKVKCDRVRPTCKNCLQRGNECVYAGERREPRRRRALHDRKIGARLQHTMHQTPPGPSVPVFRPIPPMERADPISLPSSPEEGAPTAVQPTTYPWEGGLLDAILDGDDVDPLQDCHPAIWMRMGNAEEYSGPSSGIAAISDLGLKWICSQVPDSDELCHTIQYVRNGLLTHLRQCIPPQPSPNPEMPAVWKALPPPEIVHEYVDAYFSSVQTLFPVVDAVIFDEMLAQWYQQPERQTDSWKALLNAVLASGCRAALSNDTAPAFKASSNESWGFFQNALNYEPKLVHSATDVLSVQALAVMAVFAQGMSCSQRLEYILCSTAARLAHSLALNRHVPKHWHMSEREKRERYRLFWVIYCLDKGIALRSGRPPVIQDEDISCPFPRDVQYGPPGLIVHQRELDIEEAQFDFFFHLTKFYRICSLVAQRLYSTSALCRPTSELRTTAEEILIRLELWCESIPLKYRPSRPFSCPPNSTGLLRMQILVLHFSYHYAVCAIHRRFTAMFQGNGDDKLEGISPQGSYIEAARSMALLTRHLDIESYIPAWLLFYYPTTALATIFMHTVTNPSSTSAQHDIALMETVAGFFGRLEFMTLGEAAFTRTSEFARQARHVVARVGEQSQDMCYRSSDSNGSNRRLDSASQVLAREINHHESADNVSDLSAKITAALEPSFERSAGTTRQINLDFPDSQVHGHVVQDSEEEWGQPGSVGPTSNPRHDMANNLDISLSDVLSEYSLDAWLHANPI